MHVKALSELTPKSRHVSCSYHNHLSMFLRDAGLQIGAVGYTEYDPFQDLWSCSYVVYLMSSWLNVFQSN